MNSIFKTLKKKESLVVIPFLFALVLLNSCGAKYAEGVERYAYKECYKLDSQEKMVGIDSIVSEKYASIFELGKHQMPLNRAFKSNNYETYIGLALSSNSSNLYEDHLKANEITLLKNSKEDKKYHLLFKKDDVFVYRLIYNEPVKEITVVINFVSDDEKVITDMYSESEKFLTKKLNCGKK